MISVVVAGGLNAQSGYSVQTEQHFKFRIFVPADLTDDTGRLPKNVLPTASFSKTLVFCLER